MRRIKLVIAALALVVSMFAAFAGPAMALDCRNVPGPDVRCDGTYYAPVDNYGYNYRNPYYWDWYSPYYWGWDNFFEVF